MSELKEYTLAEVSTKNGKNGEPVWLVIRDQVYDVTTFALEHPGGMELILDEAGTDATKAFDDVGHSSDATTILKTLRIGQLVEADRKQGRKKTAKKADEEGTNEKRSFVSVVTCGLCG